MLEIGEFVFDAAAIEQFVPKTEAQLPAWRHCD